MRSKVASLAFVVLVVAGAGTARSASLIVEDEWRWVRAGGAPSGVFVESDGSPHFTASIDGSCCSLHAEQDSTLAEDSFFGTGSFSASAEASEAAYSYFNVVFHVSEIATYVLEGSFGRPLHELVEAPQRRMKTRSIHEDDLGVWQVPDSTDAGACALRTARDDRHLLPDEPIQQG
jgi:hypothetical protein